jgi:hypothetical protein
MVHTSGYCPSEAVCPLAGVLRLLHTLRLVVDSGHSQENALTNRSR